MSCEKVYDDEWLQTKKHNFIFGKYCLFRDGENCWTIANFPSGKVQRNTSRFYSSLAGAIEK